MNDALLNRSPSTNPSNSTPEPAPISFSTETDPEILDIFRSECETIFAEVTERLAALSSDNSRAEELWEIRRHVHTFKGSAAILGFNELSAMAHKIEDHIEILSSSSGHARQTHINTLCLHIGDLKTNAEALFCSDVPLIPEHTSEPNKQNFPEPACLQKVAVTYPGAGSSRPVESQRSAVRDRFTRVKNKKLEELDTLLNRLELSLRTSSITRDVETETSALSEVDRLQQLVFELRNVPFETLRPRLERSARAAAEEFVKPVEVRIVGGDLMINAELLEDLTEPLTHMMRNCVVHGIEDPARRRYLGKPEVGTITVEYKDLGWTLELTVSDDGAGIDTESVKRRALESGLADVTSIETASESEVHELIFAEGLSTASRLSLNAGRGIGMGIVKQSIQSIGGSIGVNSVADKGASFTFALPAKYDRLEAFVFRVGDELYGIPTNTGFSLDISEQALSRHLDSGGEVIELGRTIDPAMTDARPLAVLSGGDGECLILGDRSYGSVRIFIEADSFTKVDDPRIVGRGRFDLESYVSILDPQKMFRGRNSYEAFNEPVVTDGDQDQDYILVVDDSEVVRNAHRSIIVGLGHHCEVFSDAGDALDLMKDRVSLPKAIITDLEMPQINGLEFVKRFRDLDNSSSVPVIMVTSVDIESMKHEAITAGVTAVISKPISRSDLADLLNIP